MVDSKKSFWDSTVCGFASQGIQGAIGAGLGLLLQKGQDRRQIRQQEKLQALEVAGQKQLTDYSNKSNAPHARKMQTKTRIFNKTLAIHFFRHQKNSPLLPILHK